MGSIAAVPQTSYVLRATAGASIKISLDKVSVFRRCAPKGNTDLVSATHLLPHHSVPTAPLVGTARRAASKTNLNAANVRRGTAAAARLALLGPKTAVSANKAGSVPVEKTAQCVRRGSTATRNIRGRASSARLVTMAMKPDSTPQCARESAREARRRQRGSSSAQPARKVRSPHQRTQWRVCTARTNLANRSRRKRVRTHVCARAGSS